MDGISPGLDNDKLEDSPEDSSINKPTADPNTLNLKAEDAWANEVKVSFKPHYRSLNVCINIFYQLLVLK